MKNLAIGGAVVLGTLGLAGVALYFLLRDKEPAEDEAPEKQREYKPLKTEKELGGD